MRAWTRHLLTRRPRLAATVPPLAPLPSNRKQARRLSVRLPPPSGGKVFEYKLTIDIGRSAECRAVFHDHGRPDYRGVVLVDNATPDRSGLGRRCRHEEDCHQR